MPTQPSLSQVNSQNADVEVPRDDDSSNDTGSAAASGKEEPLDDSHDGSALAAPKPPTPSSGRCVSGPQRLLPGPALPPACRT